MFLMQVKKKGIGNGVKTLGVYLDYQAVELLNPNNHAETT